MKQIILFLLSFILWILLTASNGAIRAVDIYTGIIVSLIVGFVMRGMSSKYPFHVFNPIQIFWFIVYICVLLYNIIKANFDVAYRVLHPDMPIHPGVVKVKTKLKGAMALTVLANSITLTPGTHTVEATADGVLYVHWINVKTSDVDEASKIIVGRFEWVLKRIFK